MCVVTVLVDLFLCVGGKKIAIFSRRHDKIKTEAPNKSRPTVELNINEKQSDSL